MHAGPSLIFRMALTIRSKPSSSQGYAGDLLIFLCTTLLPSKPLPFARLAILLLAMTSRPKLSLHPVHSLPFSRCSRHRRMVSGRRPAGQSQTSLQVLLPRSRQSLMPTSSRLSLTFFRTLTSRRGRRRAGQFPMQLLEACKSLRRSDTLFRKVVSNLFVTY